jgi:hypothetical protein
MIRNIEEKIQRIKAGVKKYVNCEKLLFVFAKSNNDNCIVFLYDEDSDDSLVPMWLHLEPKDTEKHLREGNVSLMSTLSQLENELMGCELVVNETTGKFLVKLNQSGMQDREFELVLDADGNPVVLSTLNGKQCRLDFGYCELKAGMLPDYFLMHGIDTQTGDTLVERVEYNL